MHYKDFPHGSDGKASAYNAGDLGSILGSGRSPVEGNDNPLQYSCLENPMDRGAWQATVYRVAKSRTRLSDLTYLLICNINTTLIWSMRYISQNKHLIIHKALSEMRLPSWLSSKESDCQAGDTGQIPGSERSFQGYSNLLQYSCLGNSKDREAWRATVPGVAKSQT